MVKKKSINKARIKVCGLIAISFLLAFVLVGEAFETGQTARAQGSGTGEIYHVPLEDDTTITAGNVAFAKRVIEEAERDDAEAVLITLYTPGGLVDATLDLCTTFFNTQVPVVVYVYPQGAWAMSAGAFILISADVAVMSPATGVGAAQPVMMSPEGGSEPADEKTTQALANRIREFAENQDRSKGVAERFVTENLSLGPVEALEKDVIDFKSSSLEELLEVLDGHSLEKQGETITLNTAEASLVEKNMSSGERLQDFVSDPQIAFLLLMGGVMLLYIGFSNPGTFVPEVLGGISLVMGVFGLGLFDINTTGIILMLLGIGLMVAEAFTAGFGIMGIGGAIALLIGALLLPLEPLMEEDWYGTFMVTVVGTVIGVSLILLVIIQRVIHSRREGTRTQETIFNLPAEGVVSEELNPSGMVKARGEHWRARSADGSTLTEGEDVVVVDNDGLVLLVKPKSKLN